MVETPLHATLGGNAIDYNIGEGIDGSCVEVGPRPVLVIAMLSSPGQTTVDTNVVAPGSLVRSGCHCTFTQLVILDLVLPQAVEVRI